MCIHREVIKMNEKKNKSNAEAVADYHKKLVNLATVRVPSPDLCGYDYKEEINKYLKQRYGVSENGKQLKSMNEYILDLIEKDINEWHGQEQKAFLFKKGIKETKI